jgi:hypothetical protein
MAPERKLAEIRKDVVDTLVKLEEDIAAPPPPRRPYSGRQSPDHNRNRVTEFTKPTQALIIEMSRRHSVHLGEKYIPVNKWVCRGRGGRCRETMDHGPQFPELPWGACNHPGKQWEQVQYKCDTLVDIPIPIVVAGSTQRMAISIEAEGRGTASASEERDRLLAEQGILVLHTPNEILTKYAWWVADLFALLVKPR